MAMNNLKATKVTAEEIRRDPKILDGRSVTGDMEEKLSLKDMTINKATLVDFRAIRSRISNVVFNDCRFIKANFRLSEFENVTFNGGSMAYQGDSQQEENLTNFEDSIFKGQIIFNKVKFDLVYLYGVGSKESVCRVLFKDMRQINNKDRFATIQGYGINLRVDNCLREGDIFGSLDENSTVYATNSTFINSGFAGNRTKTIYIENCELLKGSSGGAAVTMVIKNSIVAGALFGQLSKKAYLINNKYPGNGPGLTSLGGGPGLEIFIDGQGVKEARMNILSGQVTVKDLELIKPMIGKVFDYQVKTLNLKNVILRGPNFEELRLESGTWEKVEIYPPARVPDTVFVNLRVHQVTFPKGKPWVEATSKSSVNLIESPTPFDWPEISVPTPKDLDLE
ncbi:MAG: pentapeptide repeat-containing protein [Deltaproteobacteria bacterium]|jgi:uncharacterized protein YjbI with pentapeptide repeats|nr:pentapeptide repeat-containing protein [Deltaproteobacteria bacterium]